MQTMPSRSPCSQSPGQPVTGADQDIVDQDGVVDSGRQPAADTIAGGVEGTPAGETEAQDHGGIAPAAIGDRAENALAMQAFGGEFAHLGNAVAVGLADPDVTGCGLRQKAGPGEQGCVGISAVVDAAFDGEGGAGQDAVGSKGAQAGCRV